MKTRNKQKSRRKNTIAELNKLPELIKRDLVKALDDNLAFPWKKDDELLAEFIRMTETELYENEIIYRFGLLTGFLMKKLNVYCLHLHCRSPTAFPDAILIRRDTDEVISIEFETVDSNFDKHGHDASKCDMIVCYLRDKKWKNPVTVFELNTQELYPPSK